MKGQLMRVALLCQDCGTILQFAINKKPGETYMVPKRVMETHVCPRQGAGWGSHPSTSSEVGMVTSPSQGTLVSRSSGNNSRARRTKNGGTRSTEASAEATSGAR